MSSLTAVVLLYRNWPGVRVTLDSLLASTAAVDHVVVVDNGSEEGDLRELAAAYPSVDVVRAPGNDGYAAGMNLGVREAERLGSSHVLLLTHDVLLDASCVAELMVGMTDGTGLCGPLLLRRDEPDVVWSAGGTIDRAHGLPGHQHIGEPASAVPAGPPRAVEWVDGAVLLLSLEALLAVGGLSEDYFLYWEEVDLALRLSAAGFGIVLCPSALAWQAPGMAPPYLDARNGTLVLWRHGMRRVVPRAVVRQLRAGLGGVKRGEAWQLPARVVGVLDAATGRRTQRWLLRRSTYR